MAQPKTLRRKEDRLSKDIISVNVDFVNFQALAATLWHDLTRFLHRTDKSCSDVTSLSTLGHLFPDATGMFNATSASAVCFSLTAVQ